jgi:SlyX protein
MDSVSESRLVALESRLAYHERVVEDLSDVVAQQAQTIEALNTHLRIIKQRLSEVEQGWERSPQDDKPPPHY